MIFYASWTKEKFTDKFCSTPTDANTQLRTHYDLAVTNVLSDNIVFNSMVVKLVCL